MGLFLQEPGQFTSIVEALKDIPEVGLATNQRK